MSASSSFSQKPSGKQLKICCTCARVSFSLNREEAKFLTEIIQRCDLQVIRGWLKAKIVKGPGRRGLDVEKMRAIGLIQKHRVRCLAAQAYVHIIDEACFLWIPRGVVV